MDFTDEAQAIFNHIETLKDKIRRRRMKLAQAGTIDAEWTLGNRQEALNFISRTADKAGLSQTDKKQAIDNFNQRLGDPMEPITVAILENQLINLQSQINEDLLRDIVQSIQEPGEKIKNATNEIQLAIDKLNNLNEIFSAITIAVNLIAGFVSASFGKFNPLVSIASKLLA